MSFRIIGTGRYIPERVVTNDELSTMVDTSDDWITERVGVKRRHIATHESAAEMAYEAAKSALESSGTQASELDLILVATVSGDLVSPSTACMVQKLLGADCMAYDINAACSAFLFLLETADGYFARGKAKKALIIGTERTSRIVDWTDRSTCVIFGDGAGACVLAEGDGYRHPTFTVQGGDEVIRIPNHSGKSPFWEGKDEHPYIWMNGQETFKYAVNSISRDIKTVLDDANLTIDDIKFVVPHQANYRIIELAARRSKVPLSKFVMNIDEYGNTSSASIPIVLDELNRAGKLLPGDKIILTAFGGGLASAACLIVW